MIGGEEKFGNSACAVGNHSAHLLGVVEEKYSSLDARSTQLRPFPLVDVPDLRKRLPVHFLRSWHHFLLPPFTRTSTDSDTSRRPTTPSFMGES